MILANWGNFPKVDAEVSTFVTDEQARTLLERPDPWVLRGLGRSYGDSSLGRYVLSTLEYNQILSFDPASGELICEAGITLEQILASFVPRGWFLPTTPGTKFVTLGGALAADVHGKNHHRTGSFSEHVNWLDLLLASGEILRCSATENPGLFLATCGGMGLTGLILRVSINLVPLSTSYIRQELIQARSLSEIMALFEESTHWPYSVAWIDCLTSGRRMGRSVMMRGEHARAEHLAKFGSRHAKNHPLEVPRKGRMRVPFDFPAGTLNRATVSLFNALYYHKCTFQKGLSLVDYEQFFYPLDAVVDWNRIYGRRGFTQYQFVLPMEAGLEGMTDILKRITQSGQGSFLAVIKLLGHQRRGLISFPRRGFTLALDFPMRPGLFKLLDTLDAAVLDHGGRLYLAKDARMSAAVFRAGYPGADAFAAIRRRYDPDGKFTSLQAQRIGF